MLQLRCGLKKGAIIPRANSLSDGLVPGNVRGSKNLIGQSSEGHSCFRATIMPYVYYSLLQYLL